MDVAVLSDDAERVIELASTRLGHPLGLVDVDGRTLGVGPPDQDGQRALAVARAAARSDAVPPPGWRVFSLAQQTAPLGFLAVGTSGPSDPETRSALTLLPLLLTDQLRRTMLVRLHTAAFVRRLVSDPPRSAHLVRGEAAKVGLTLAHAYWPAVLAWPSNALRGEALDALERDAQALREGSLTASLNGHLVLLHPAGADPTPAHAWFAEVAHAARARAPSSRARVVRAEQPVEPSSLGAQVAHLARLCHLGPRAEGDRVVTRASEYALDELLHRHIDPASAARFVEQHIGRLIAWDREHRSDLVAVLEASLDFARHDEAARHCFMHRNTFRHRLAQAHGVLGARMEDPSVRLAIHVAVKLRRVM